MLSPSEVSLAVQLIEGMSAGFEATRYRDTYAEELKKLIESKAKGQKREIPEPKAGRTNVIDLVSALQESLGKVKKGKKKAAS